MKVYSLIILLTSFSAYGICTIKQDVYNESHSKGCSYAIVDEKGKILSQCFSENDKTNGLIDRYMYILADEGKCPKENLPKECLIKSGRVDESHPNGCSYAIVDEKGKILSQCFSENDKTNGLIDRYMHIFADEGKCPKENLPKECLIKSGRVDESHPNGCSYAIVDEKGKILSPCFSENDKTNGLVDRYMHTLIESKQCPFELPSKIGIEVQSSAKNKQIYDSNSPKEKDRKLPNNSANQRSYGISK